MGVVYHPNSLRFVERSRVAFLKQQSVPFSKVLAAGVGLVISEVQAKYWRPLRFEEQAYVYTRQLECLPKKMVMEQFILKDEIPVEQRLKSVDRYSQKIFSCLLTLVPVGLDNLRSTELPANLREMFGALNVVVDK